MAKKKLKPYWGEHCPSCKFIGTLIISGEPQDVYLSCGLTKYLIADKKHKSGDYATIGSLDGLHQPIGFNLI